MTTKYNCPDGYLSKFSILYNYCSKAHNKMEVSFDKTKYDQILREKFEVLKNIYPLYPRNNWQLEKEKYGIKIHSVYDSSTELKIIRSQGIVKSPASKIIEMGHNIEIATEWDNTLESVKIIHKTEDDYALIQTVTKKVPLVTQRESFILSKIFHNEEDGSTFVVSTSCDIPGIKSSSDRVTAQIHLLGWVMNPDVSDPNITNLTVILHVDPKGWIPKSLFNSFAHEQGFNMRFLAAYAEKKYREESSSSSSEEEEEVITSKDETTIKHDKPISSSLHINIRTN